MKKKIKIACMLLLVGNLGLLPGFANAQCYITGCNGQTCSDAPQEDFGACEYTIEGSCYTRYGICEEDQNGVCGWRQSNILQDCISNIQQQTSPSVIPTNEQPRSQPDSTTPAPYNKAPRSVPDNPVPCSITPPGSPGGCNGPPHAAY